MSMGEFHKMFPIEGEEPSVWVNLDHLHAIIPCRDGGSLIYVSTLTFRITEPSEKVLAAWELSQ